MINAKTYFVTTPIKYYTDVNNDRDMIMQDTRNRAIVYQWYCKITGMSYIGSSYKGNKRLGKYWIPSALDTQEISIYTSIKKYGHENHYLAILEDLGDSKTTDLKYLISREQYYLDMLLIKDKNLVMNKFNKVSRTYCQDGNIQKNLRKTVLAN